MRTRRDRKSTLRGGAPEKSARRRAAAAVKVAHSALVAVMATASLTILVDGVMGRRDLWLVLALAVVGVEGVVYAANGLRCPLTQLARWLGDPTGHDWVCERLLPERWVVRVAPFFAWVSFLGLLAMGVRWLLQVPA